ncbi:Beta_tubulin [Hexamita inflata]|uniref:Tubulin beta chain n=1 Tax=Hexamita inflata TaxID=28002 RepID=A0AA86Q1Z2_9EUKA|nr:Beta tubulin [Hexamita inflata]
MREILTIQVGQCGNNLASSFWEGAMLEHQIQANGLLTDPQEPVGNQGVYFQEASNGRHVPRSVLVDLEPTILDKIRKSNIGGLFKPENIISGIDGAGNNWAKGHYTEGAEIVDSVMEAIRKQNELSDVTNIFQMVHSIGGGTGSGLGSLICDKLREEYDNATIFNQAVLPGIVMDCLVEAYNVGLTLPHLLEASDQVFLIDNIALYEVYFKQLKLQAPMLADLNKLITDHSLCFTSAWRFPSSGVDEKKIKDMMQHFKLGSLTYIKNDIVFNYTCQTELLTKSIAVSTCQTPEVVKSEIKIISDSQNNNQNQTALLQCSKNVSQPLERMRHQFSRMFERNAFLQYYLAQGMDRLEFQDSLDLLQEQVQKYEQQ